MSGIVQYRLLAYPEGPWYDAVDGGVDAAALPEGYETRTLYPAPPVEAQPVAWCVYADSGDIRIWWSDYERACGWARNHGLDQAKLQPLYPVPGAPVTLTDDQIWHISRYQAPMIYDTIPSGEVFKFARALLSAQQGGKS